MTDTRNEIRERLIERLDDWLEKAGRLHGCGDVPMLSLRFSVQLDQWDDDDVPWLDVRVEDTEDYQSIDGRLGPPLAKTEAENGSPAAGDDGASAKPQ